MKLLGHTDLIQTSRVDHADWNYRPGLSFVMRRRFALALSLLPREKVSRLLEVGFGSGIFVPELAVRAKDIYGIDVHSRTDEVRAVLEAQGVHANLSRQDAARTDFQDCFFNAIVSISAIEFVDNIGDAALELARILHPGGSLIIVMPAQSPLLDYMLRLVTGEDARRDYGDRRAGVIPALLTHFRLAEEKRFAPVYRACRFIKA